MARNYGNLILVDLIKFANHGILPNVRLILGLPYNAHTYLLGPLMGQIGIREQLYNS